MLDAVYVPRNKFKDLAIWGVCAAGMGANGSNGLPRDLAFG